jgi:transposase
MRATTLLRNVLCLKHTVVTDVRFTGIGLEVDVTPTTKNPRCGGCGKQCDASHYDRRERRWRHLDFAGMRVEFRFSIRRVECSKCDVITELVPWAVPDSWFTSDFEQAVALLAQHTNKTVISKIFGIDWETVGRIIKRVVDRLAPTDLLDNLVDIGVDEIAYLSHHSGYLTIVTDHVTGRVCWADVGKSADTLNKFFEQLGPERTKKLQHISIDMSKAYIKSIQALASHAKIVFDRFHVQRLAHDALDEVRRDMVRQLKGAKAADEAGAADVIKGSRWALHKNPMNLFMEESDKISDIQRTCEPLYRAYIMKEALREILDRRQVNVARAWLLKWIAWAQRSRLKPFIKLAKTIKQYIEGILAYIQTGLNNGRSEGLNNKIRSLIKMAYGFHNAASILAYVFLCCAGIVINPVRKFPRLRCNTT